MQTEVLYNKKDFILISNLKADTYRIITPYYRIDNKIISNFKIPAQASNRALRFRNIEPRLVDVDIVDKGLTVDLCQPLCRINQEIQNNLFENNNNGYKYLTINTSEAQGKFTIDKMVVEAEVENLPTEQVKGKIIENCKTSFRVQEVKVFTITGTRGFILTAITPENHAHMLFTAELTDSDDQEIYITSGFRTIVVDLVKKIIPVWPLFEAYVGKSTDIFLNVKAASVLTPLYEELDTKVILFSCTRKLDEDIVVVKAIAKM